jgi:hypothetical protein
VKKREREREAASRTEAHAGSPENGKWHLIAMKAYELYERRGRTHGHDIDDWFEAEAIVNGKTNTPGA